MFSLTLAIALLTAQVASAVDARPATPADSILRNGRIVYIGTNEQAEKFAGPKTEVTDLRGRMVMPGIVDGHFHGTSTQSPGNSHG